MAPWARRTIPGLTARTVIGMPLGAVTSIRYVVSIRQGTAPGMGRRETTVGYDPGYARVRRRASVAWPYRTPTCDPRLEIRRGARSIAKRYLSRGIEPGGMPRARARIGCDAE